MSILVCSREGIYVYVLEDPSIEMIRILAFHDENVRFFLVESRDFLYDKTRLCILLTVCIADSELDSYIVT